ncbi:MAG: NAD(P)/FAD-dependent oxidoreductase [Lentisphaeria bacterium]|nr:NAD(P)/FAD-dependent oxidoreductase [Lentisphaeria bacterium]
MKIVIAGGGPAAVESAVAARKSSPDAQIDIYSEESFLPYRRPTLSGLLGADRKLDDKTFYIKTADFFTSQNIGFHPGEKALAVKDKTLLLSSGKSIVFDRLILACGSNAVRPGLPGAERAYTLRSLRDMQKLASRLDEGVKNAVVIGGGVLGLEIADSLLTRKINTVVLEASAQLFPGKLPENDAEALAERLNNLPGLHIHFGKFAEKITEGSVILKDGTVLPADLVIFACGSIPELSLAQSAGVVTGRGIIVNEFMQSSREDIFAAGDMAEFNGRCFNLYMDAVASGKVAGSNAAGDKIPFAAKISPVRLFALGEKLTMP